MTRSELETKIREALTEITMQDVSNVPTDADLREAVGLDSLGRLELLAEFEVFLGVTFDDLGEDDAHSIASLIAVAEKHISLELVEVA